MIKEYMIVGVKNGQPYIAREHPGDANILFADGPATAADLLLSPSVERVRMIYSSDAIAEIKRLFVTGGNHFD